MGGRRDVGARRKPKHDAAVVGRHEDSDLMAAVVDDVEGGSAIRASGAVGDSSRSQRQPLHVSNARRHGRQPAEVSLVPATFATASYQGIAGKRTFKSFDGPRAFTRRHGPGQRLAFTHLV